MSTVVVYAVGEIRSAGRRCKGREIPGEVLKGTSASIVLGESILVSHEERHIVFAVGDEAVYDSWNLVYTGKITSIGAKTVTVTEDGRSHRLSVYEFCLRNRKFDAEAIRARNAETMQAI